MKFTDTPCSISPASRARDHGCIVVHRKGHGAFKSMRPHDEDAESAIERVGGDPRFVRAARVFATRNHGSFDGLAVVCGDTSDREDRERHTRYFSGLGRRRLGPRSASMGAHGAKALSVAAEWGPGLTSNQTTCGVNTAMECDTPG